MSTHADLHIRETLCYFLFSVSVFSVSVLRKKMSIDEMFKLFKTSSI